MTTPATMTATMTVTMTVTMTATMAVTMKVTMAATLAATTGSTSGLRRRAVIAATAVALLVGSAWTAGAPATAADPTALAFGALPQTRGGQTQQQAAEALEAQIGRKLEVVRVFERWEDTFPDSFHTWVRDGGRTIILSVKPTRANGSSIGWSAIANAAPGSQLDGEIRSWARRVRDFGAPIFVTFHHEPEQQANTGYGTATDYIAAWRHWVDVFRDEGATNAQFMWILTANAHGLPSSDRRYAPKWYPGDGWVDTMGVDAYNWAECRSATTPWRSLAQIIEPFRQFGLAHPTKPLWLTEWASWEDPDVAGRKAQWIDDARGLFGQPAYSQFAGVSYFNSTHTGNGSFPDCLWWVDTSASSLASFTAMGADPLYQGDPFGPPGNTPPVARIGASCTLRRCTFDGTASSDADGTVVAWSWSFGDGAIATAATADHTYATDGRYTVTLTVTDDGGATATSTTEVAVSESTATAPSFRAATQANGLVTAATITVPGQVQAGDRLVYMVTAGLATTITTPNGWTLLATASAGTPDMRSWVFTRVADASSAGTTVSAALGTRAKTSRVLVAYAGAGAPSAIASSVAATATTSHATPAVGVADAARVISYWSDKTNDNTGWAVPAQVASRATSTTSGSGRITAAVGDSEVVAPGGWPGATATSGSSSAKAIMWSIVLPPG